MIYRHGDVCIKSVEKIPEGAIVKKSHILAEGEVTGHAHKLLNDGFTLFEKDGILYLSVKEITPLVHEEHDTIEIQEGTYIIQTEREFDPFTEEINKTKD